MKYFALIFILLCGCDLAGTPGALTRDDLSSGRLNDFPTFTYNLKVNGDLKDGSVINSDETDISIHNPFQNTPTSLATTEELCGVDAPLTAEIRLEGELKPNSLALHTVDGFKTFKREDLQDVLDRAFVSQLSLDNDVILCRSGSGSSQALRGIIRDGDEYYNISRDSKLQSDAVDPNKFHLELVFEREFTQEEKNHTFDMEFIEHGFGLLKENEMMQDGVRDLAEQTFDSWVQRIRNFTKPLPTGRRLEARGILYAGQGQAKGEARYVFKTYNREKEITEPALPEQTVHGYIGVDVFDLESFEEQNEEPQASEDPTSSEAIHSETLEKVTPPVSAPANPQETSSEEAHPEPESDFAPPLSPPPEEEEIESIPEKPVVMEEPSNLNVYDNPAISYIDLTRRCAQESFMAYIPFFGDSRPDDNADLDSLSKDIEDHLGVKGSGFFAKMALNKKNQYESFFTLCGNQAFWCPTKGQKDQCASEGPKSQEPSWFSASESVQYTRWDLQNDTLGEFKAVIYRTQHLQELAKIVTQYLPLGDQKEFDDQVVVVGTLVRTHHKDDQPGHFEIRLSEGMMKRINPHHRILKQMARKIPLNPKRTPKGWLRNSMALAAH